MKRLIVTCLFFALILIPVSTYAEDYPCNGTILKSAVNVRENANAKSKKIGELSKNQSVNGLDDASDNNGQIWYKVEIKSGKTGYVRGDLLKIDASSNTDDEKTTNVTNEIANAQTQLNPNNKHGFIARGKDLLAFLTLAMQNDYSIDVAKRNGDTVFASAVNNNTETPICYMVENQRVYSVSIIERNKGDMKKENYMDCAIAMAKSLNYQITTDVAEEAIQIAIKNPGIGVITSVNDTQFIYESDEGTLSIYY